jgi:hypothetical protein
VGVSGARKAGFSRFEILNAGTTEDVSAKLARLRSRA